VTQTNGKKTLAEPVIEVSLDQDDYTNGELEDLEDRLGGNLNVLLKPRQPPPHKYVLGLLWLTIRRTRPDVTWEEVRAMRGSAWAVAPPAPLPESGEPSELTSSPPSAPSTG
jgi:hypothetical protein